MNQIPTKQDGWHLKKEVQITQIITIFTVAISAFWYIAKLEQRIAIIEAAVVAQKERDAMQDMSARETIGQLRVSLDRIDGKIDRLIERPSK